MKHYFRYIFFTGCFLFLLASCSRKKNTFINRNFHAVTAEYNTLYNGDVALEKGLQGLANSYIDNYWDILPVERLEIFENITRPGESKSPDFDRAEEKAIKAIQNHAMKIEGEEYNPQMDEAFILLGKSRYYSQRFIPALEAFNYVLAYYPASNNIAQAKIWKEKTNIRLNNNELAIDNLEKLFKVEKKLKDQDKADAYAMLSQAYINLGRLDTALIYMKDAARLTRKVEEEGRYHFIKGQLYNALSFKDSANMAFDEVIDLNRRIPRKYWINAQLEKIKNFDYDSGDDLTLMEFFTKLEENRENRPYLDKIYYTKAEYYAQKGNQDSAMALYERSLRQSAQDPFLRSRDYLSLAEYYFNDAEYQNAGAYYDSVLSNIEERSREYRSIKKKKENLTDVILFENLTERNDSIMRIALLPEEEQRAFFEAYIKEYEEKQKQDSIRKATIIRNNEFFTKDGPAGNNTAGAKGRDVRSGGQVAEFYFYNQTAVAYGKQDFKRIWGERANEDNWRLSSKQRVRLDGSGTPVDLVAARVTTPELTVDGFMAEIPKGEAALDSLKQERDNAYYQLGLIYKEKFKEYERAAAKLETLLSYEPADRLVLPTYYNLYQTYEALNELAPSVNYAGKAETYKNTIINEYADSRYAAILKNPEAVLDDEAQGAEAIYNQLYRQFQAQEYASLLENLDKQIAAYYGDPFVPKFELLKATALGRYKGYDAYKTALEYVGLTYPRSDEGKKAQALLQTSVPGMAFRNFVPASESVNWKLLYPFRPDEMDVAKETAEKMNKALEEVGYANYEVSLDVYSPDTVFLVIHYLESQQRAGGLAEMLATHKEHRIDREGQVISSDNYRIVQLHKNLEAYIAQYSE